ncbi:MAG: hypothetical protein ACPHUJ_04285, partial [Pseudomonadales bacterium]
MTHLLNRTRHSSAAFCFGLIVTLLLPNDAYASLSNVSASQDGSDSTSPFLFTVSYTINTNYGGNGNGRVNGVKLEYDNGGGYQQLGSCATSGFPNGNTKNGQNGALQMSDISATGLTAGTYNLRLTVYTNAGNSSGSACSADANVATISNFAISSGNSAPAVTDAGATLAYTEGDSATVIDGTLTITDVDDTNMEGATITISSGYQSSEDVLAFTNANGITGSWDSGNGVLTLSGSASKANYETAFESITYQNTNTDDPNNANRTITWVVNDGESNSSGVTSTITVADVNDAPVVSDAGATLAYTEGDSATVIDGTLTITDVDDTNMEGATITISSGYQSSEDVLA